MRNYGKRLIDKLCKTFPLLEIYPYCLGKSTDYCVWFKDTIICVISCYCNKFYYWNTSLFLREQFKYKQFYIVYQYISEILNT